MNGPNSGMYKVDRLYDSPTSFSNTLSMYSVKNIFENDHTHLTHVMQARQPSMEKTKDIDELEQRQERLFQQLERLAAKLQQIKQQMAVVPPSVTIPEINKEQLLATSQSQLLDTTLGVVITASPTYKPLSLVIMYHWMCEKLKVSMSSYVHSSVTSSEPHQRIFQKVCTDNDEEWTSHPLVITFIWKEVGLDPLLMISPTKQATISGEVNLLRFITSSFLPSAGFEAPIQATEVDHWLDTAHVCIVHGNNKERQGVLRTLNSHLGRTEYLVGGRLSVADVGMLGALLQTISVPDFPNNVKQWFKRCASNTGVNSALEAFSINAA